MNRNGRDHAVRFPDIVEAIRKKAWSRRTRSHPLRRWRTLKWSKVKVPHYREGERGWEPSKK